VNSVLDLSSKWCEVLKISCIRDVHKLSNEKNIFIRLRGAWKNIGTQKNTLNSRELLLREEMFIKIRWFGWEITVGKFCSIFINFITELENHQRR
jgi:NDP-sugar pyrophosphorylase family protein